jgi:uncharacterized membrane protein YccC
VVEAQSYGCRRCWKTGSVRLLRLSDPGHFALRAAVRTAVVVPVAFAIGQVGVGNSDTALFAAFGALAFLVFVDFGGPRPARLAAYLALLLTGAALITVGTLCSRSPALAVAAMAVIGFVVLFAGIVNGYLAAAGNAVLLSFILPVMVPAGVAEIPARLAGWGIGGALATTAVMVLWPQRPRDELRAAAADACRALADLVAEPHVPANEEAARVAVRAVRARFVDTPFRPTGSTGAGAALASLVDEIGWLLELAVRGPADGPECVRARAANVDVLRESAARLAGHRLPIEVDRLVSVGEDLLDGLLGRVADPGVRDDEDALRAALRSTGWLWVMSYATLQIGELAGVAASAVPPLAADHPLAAARRLAADHASLRSVWLRNTLRATAGLTLAVLVGQLASVQHSFWVVLGTLSVLRSSALGTGASALQALIGTTIGIVAGGALVFAIGTDETVLWIVFPPAILLAAYAPRAISFAAGQAGFTVALLILFNLIEPSGWEVGLVRVEDVAIGFAISIVVGLLFWPRGASAVLWSRLDEAYQACAGYVAASLGRLFDGGSADRLTEPRQEAVTREHLLDAAVRQFISERAPTVKPMHDVATLIEGAVRLRVAGDSIAWLGEQVEGAPRPDAARDLSGDIEVVRAWYGALGAALAERVAPPAPAVAESELPPDVLEGLREAVVTGDSARTIAAVAVGWGCEHLDVLRRVEDRIAEAAARLTPSAPQPVPASNPATAAPP